MFRSNFMKYFSVLCLAAGVLLAACNSNVAQLAGGGIGGTGITNGTVTGFGSIFVNGVEFDTAGAVRNIDDVVTISNGTDDSSVIGSGMVVTIAGTVNPDGVTGTASLISYDEVVSGPVDSTPVADPDGVHKTFGVLGLTISVDRNSTVFVNTDFQSLQANDVMDVSGYFDNAGTLLATRLEKVGVLGQGTVVEVRGTVSGFDGIDTFSIGALGVSFDGTTVFEDLPGTVGDGQFVEVEGVLQGAASIRASRIEREDSDLGYFTGDISIEGVVTAYVDAGNFMLNGLPVNASNATFSPASLGGTLANDMQIEVDGTIAAGMILADRIEQRGGRVKLAGLVATTDVNSRTISVGIVAGQPPVAVAVDAQTQLEDELLNLQPFTLVQMNSGDPVLVQGYVDNTGNVIASEIKRRVLDAYELAGQVGAASGNSAAGSVTILGVTMATDSRTEFEDGNDQAFPGGGDDFYSRVSPGDIVELEDELPADGIADQAELGN